MLTPEQHRAIWAPNEADEKLQRRIAVTLAEHRVLMKAVAVTLKKIEKARKRKAEPHR